MEIVVGIKYVEFFMQWVHCYKITKSANQLGHKILNLHSKHFLRLFFCFHETLTYNQITYIYLFLDSFVCSVSFCSIFFFLCQFRFFIVVQIKNDCVSSHKKRINQKRENKLKFEDCIINMQRHLKFKWKTLISSGSSNHFFHFKNKIELFWWRYKALCGWSAFHLISTS